jgi:hypothetical protein
MDSILPDVTVDYMSTELKVEALKEQAVRSLFSALFVSPLSARLCYDVSIF